MITLEKTLVIQKRNDRMGTFGMITAISKELVPYIGKTMNVKIVIEKME